MIVKDDDKLAEDLLKNWGLWCKSDPYRHLGYSKQPMFKDYRAPYPDKSSKSAPVIDVSSAEIAESAICRIRRKEYPRDDLPPKFFSVQEFIIEKWARKDSNSKTLEKHFGCSRKTIYNRTLRARDVFLAEYLEHIRDMQNLLNKRVA